MSKNNDAFSLNIFQGVNSPGIGSQPISEEGEFASQSYAKTGADNGVKDGTVSVPGGTGEKPTAKPEGGEHGPTAPGGDGSGKGQNYGPSIPKRTELTTDEWNRAMSALKHSFKEGYELLGMLESCRVVERSTDDLQEEYTENAILEAAFEAYADGPYYEAVRAADKGDIKSIAKTIRKKLISSAAAANWRQGKGSKGGRVALFGPSLLAARNKKLQLYAWQTVCYLYPERRSALSSVLKDLNTEFKSVLMDFELKVLKVKGIMKAEKLSEDEQQRSAAPFQAYVLIVDKPDAKPDNAVIEIELSSKNIEKLRKLIVPEKSMNECVQYFESCSKECDKEDEEDGKPVKESKEEPKEEPKECKNCKEKNCDGCPHNKDK